ncbi:MAG: hypothetical protein IPK87_03680 [Planctomycetes bacterium]|nr:hypothetical protein [Planctomycetota bacterium]
MRKWLILLWVLMLSACGAGTNNSASSAGSGDSSTAKEPETPREVLDAHMKAFCALDGLTLKRLSAKADQADFDDFEEKVSDLEKFEFEELAWREEKGYWYFEFKQTAYMKNGKSDVDPRRRRYVIQEDGKWRVTLTEPK